MRTSSPAAECAKVGGAMQRRVIRATPAGWEGVAIEGYRPGDDPGGTGVSRHTIVGKPQERRRAIPDRRWSCATSNSARRRVALGKARARALRDRSPRRRIRDRRRRRRPKSRPATSSTSARSNFTSSSIAATDRSDSFVSSMRAATFRSSPRVTIWSAWRHRRPARSRSPSPFRRHARAPNPRSPLKAALGLGDSANRSFTRNFTTV